MDIVHGQVIEPACREIKCIGNGRHSASVLQLLTKFAEMASEHAPDMQYDNPFRCQVQLEGTSAIEGIRQLAEAGITDTQLPNYVANVKSLRRNKVLIQPKAAASGRG